MFIRSPFHRRLFQYTENKFMTICAVDIIRTLLMNTEYFYSRTKPCQNTSVLRM